MDAKPVEDSDLPRMPCSTIDMFGPNALSSVPNHVWLLGVGAPNILCWPGERRNMLDGSFVVKLSSGVWVWPLRLPKEVLLWSPATLKGSSRRSSLWVSFRTSALNTSDTSDVEGATKWLCCCESAC